MVLAAGSERGVATALVLANPHAEPASVRITFALDHSGGAVSRVVVVGPTARLTVPTVSVPELSGRDFSIIVDADLPIAAERASYFATSGGGGGDAATGVPYPSAEWYIRRGVGLEIFETVVAVLNPNDQPATVRIVYHTMSGRTFVTTHRAEALSRLTVDVLTSEPRLNGEHFWMYVTANGPIVADRTMYWDRSTGVRVEGHSSHGVIEPSTRWATGDARVGGPQQYDSFLLVGNPTAQTATLRFTFKRDSGDDIVVLRDLAPFGRDTVHVNRAVPALANESFWATIESVNDVPVIVERSVYWTSGPGQTAWTGGTNTWALPIERPSYDGCRFALSPGTIVLPPAGGAGTIAVGTTTRCTFTSVADAGWIAITSGASGNGTGTVTITAAENTTGATRVAHVTIGGGTIAVSQEARAEAPSDPRMFVDVPARDSTVTQPFMIAGRALDLGASRGSGVDILHVYAYPNPGSNTAPIFLGATTYGAERPDLAALFGEAARGTGFGLTVTGLAAGRYQIVVFAHSTRTDSFNNVVVFNITVESSAQLIIDMPGAGEIVAQPFQVAGWAMDWRANTPPGIDGIHVYAYPDPGVGPRGHLRGPRESGIRAT